MSLSRRSLIRAGLVAGMFPPAAWAHDAESTLRTTSPALVGSPQYALLGGRRDRLIDMFERAFIEPRNTPSARMQGSFTDVDHPGRFVWLREIASSTARAATSSGSHGNPVWTRSNYNLATTTTHQFDLALLLRLLTGDLQLDAACHVIDVHYLRGVTASRFAGFYETCRRPILTCIGAEPCAALTSETEPNTSSALPARSRESVFVHVTAYGSLAELAEKERALARLSSWASAAPDDLMPSLTRKPKRLRLQPTAQSALR